MANGGASLRSWSTRLHRWVALVLGGWFALLGLTGMVLVWHAELDRALNPDWFAPRAACAARPDAAPVARVLATYAAVSAAPATQVIAPDVPGAAWIVSSRTPAGDRLQHFVDGACGRYLGSREWGLLRLDRAHAVPALYELHRSMLAGETGHTLLGIAGLWLFGVVVTGAVNAWPRTSTRSAWARTLTVQASAVPRRRWYDVHRAAGMWLLPFLLLMSLSGVYLCFPGQARALVARVLPTMPDRPVAPGSTLRPRLTPDHIVDIARSRWPDARWSRLQLPATADAPYEVRLLQPGEVRRDTGDTRLRLDAAGRVLAARDPLRAPAGDRLLAWMFPLHSGEALGLAGRLVWTVSGLVPALLFATGTCLWWQRRRARSAMRAPSARPLAVR